MWCDEPPLEEAPCPYCCGVGAHIFRHPLYLSAEYCDNCYGDGNVLMEKESDAISQHPTDN